MLSLYERNLEFSHSNFVEKVFPLLKQSGLLAEASDLRSCEKSENETLQKLDQALGVDFYCEIRRPESAHILPVRTVSLAVRCQRVSAFQQPFNSLTQRLTGQYSSKSEFIKRWQQLEDGLNLPDYIVHSYITKGVEQTSVRSIGIVHGRSFIRLLLRELETDDHFRHLVQYTIRECEARRWVNGNHNSLDSRCKHGPFGGHHWLVGINRNEATSFLGIYWTRIAERAQEQLQTECHPSPSIIECWNGARWIHQHELSSMSWTLKDTVQSNGQGRLFF